jgi:H+/Cl- antiporter ClcA
MRRTPSLRFRRPRVIPQRALLLAGAAVGASGGLFAALYYYLLQGGLALVWKGLAPHAPVWAVTMLGGALVGVALRTLGKPGEIAAVVDNIHMRRGRINPRKSPSMVVASLVSICFGGSAGPEAPLVQMIGSTGSWLGDRLRLRGDQVRTLTFCGMAAALGAFFGAPVGGALFALEIPHRRGLEYYEALIPALVSSFLAFGVFRLLVPAHSVLYPFPRWPEATPGQVGLGALLGVLGAGLGAGFIVMFRAAGKMSKPLERWPIALGAAGGGLLGLLSMAVPPGLPTTTLFWGEHQLAELLAGYPAVLSGLGRRAALALLALALLKGLAITVTLRSGFRGGFIFPLFFVGGATGLALSAATAGRIAPVLSVLCLAAATNVAVTRTPLSTAVILTTLSGTSMIPVIAAACLTSFLLTTRFPLIRTQRPRRNPAGAGGTKNAPSRRRGAFSEISDAQPG